MKKRRRHRNPGGLAGIAMRVVETAVPAVGMAAALGALEVQIHKHVKTSPRAVGVVAKVAVGLGSMVAAIFKPSLSKYLVPAACAAFACVGQDLGAYMAGGVMGGGKEVAAKELAGMAAEDEETFGLLLTEMNGLGILAIEGMGDPAEEAAAAFGASDPIPDDAF